MKLLGWASMAWASKKPLLVAAGLGAAGAYAAWSTSSDPEVPDARQKLEVRRPAQGP